MDSSSRRSLGRLHLPSCGTRLQDLICDRSGWTGSGIAAHYNNAKSIPAFSRGVVSTFAYQKKRLPESCCEPKCSRENYTRMRTFAPAIFLGAFLLFLVQPLIGKYILPWFGGGPGVWTVCLLFFQMFLLGGYAYAHWASRLPARRQVFLHLALVLAAVLLPVVPAQTWKPQDASHPTLHILALLTATIGAPYFVLASTSPLLQQW